MGVTVLVTDDDARIRTLVSRLLSGEGYVTVEAQNAQETMTALKEHEPDLVLLDVMLPTTDGIDLLHQIREVSSVPVIMLTALGQEADRILGLKSGADDYVVKPFSPGELTARIESVLRRTRAPEGANRMEFGELTVDRGAREVRVRGERVTLTPKEFDLLVFLASSPRQVFDRHQLLVQVWESSSEWQHPATVTEHIRRLRLKIEDDPDRPRWLGTVRGVGYRFEP